MIQLLHKLPRKVTVAFSGGVDSMAILNFLSNNHEVDAAFFHHGTKTSELAHEFVTKYCNDHNIKLSVSHLKNEKPKELSWEEHWRDERYQFLETFEYVVTGHHLNDCIETYVWSTMHGTPKVIPKSRNNIYRPFLLNSKQVFVDWCNKKKLVWQEDFTNECTDYTRNYIRKHVIPHVYNINPGIEKVVKKLILNS